MDAAEVTNQHVQGLERVAAESLKNDLTALRVEHGKGQDQLQELTNEHTKLLGTHEEMCAHVKDLEESCSALQAETSGLKSVQLELESESAKAKQDHQEQVLAISTELKQSEEAQATLIANLEEVMLTFRMLACGHGLQVLTLTA